MTRTGLGPHSLLRSATPWELAHSLATKHISCAANATHEADWPVLQELRKEFPDTVKVGLGIHPWWADAAKPGWTERLETALIQDPSAFVGEAGLDGYRASRPSGIAMETQRQVLLPQLALAKDLQRPIVLHCVKAWEHLAYYIRQTGVHEFLIHRFRGTPEIVREILQLGGSISVHMDTLCHQHSMDAIRITPISRILVETDYDGPRAEALPIHMDLENTIEGLARILNIPAHVVREQTRENALRFYR